MNCIGGSSKSGGMEGQPEGMGGSARGLEAQAKGLGSIQGVLNTRNRSERPLRDQVGQPEGWEASQWAERPAGGDGMMNGETEKWRLCVVP